MGARKKRLAGSATDRSSSVCGILQARILEWVAFPSLGDLPTPAVELESPTLQADSLPSDIW